jgi:hypothetical protein
MIRVIGFTFIDVKTLIQMAYAEGRNLAEPLDEVGKSLDSVDAALITLTNLARQSLGREIWLTTLRHSMLTVLTDGISGPDLLPFRLEILPCSLESGRYKILSATLFDWYQAILAGLVESQSTEVRRFFYAMYNYLDARGLTPLWENYHRMSLDDGTIILAR